MRVEMSHARSQFLHRATISKSICAVVRQVQLHGRKYKSNGNRQQDIEWKMHLFLFSLSQAPVLHATNQLCMPEHRMRWPETVYAQAHMSIVQSMAMAHTVQIVVQPKFKEKKI